MRMGKKKDFTPLEDLFGKGKDVQLTEAAYQARMGENLPKDSSYLKNKSPLADWAKERGYKLVRVEQAQVIDKTVYFRREK